MTLNGQALPLTKYQSDIHLAYGVEYDRAQQIYASLVLEHRRLHAARITPDVIGLMLDTELELVSVGELMLANSLANSIVLLTTPPQSIFHTHESR